VELALGDDLAGLENPNSRRAGKLLEGEGHECVARGAWCVGRS
jgi:hypothetical protein